MKRRERGDKSAVVADVATPERTDNEAEAGQDVVRDGFTLDFISGTKEVKETPKELVRQRIACALFHEYGISGEDMAADFPARVGGRRRRVDIAIFTAGESHMPEHIQRVVVCRPEPKQNKRGAVKMRDYDQAAQDIAEVKPFFEEIDACRYALWTNGLEFFFLRKKATKFQVDAEPIGDWPPVDESVEDRNVLSRARARRADPEMLRDRRHQPARRPGSVLHAARRHPARGRDSRPEGGRTAPRSGMRHRRVSGRGTRAPDGQAARGRSDQRRDRDLRGARIVEPTIATLCLGAGVRVRLRPFPDSGESDEHGDGRGRQWPPLSSEIRYAHFHGTEVAKPIPSYQVYKGTAFEQVDQAVDFVLSKINRRIGTRAESARAPRTYEIPVEVVTEAIVNAVVHRDYTDNGSVQVMLFSDRLEVRNPGRLPPPLTLENLREAHRSVPGNPLLGEALYLTAYIERMGTGTLDMIRRCVETSLPEPEFAVVDGFVTTIRRVVIPRRESGQTMGAAVAATGIGPVGYGVPVQTQGHAEGQEGQVGGQAEGQAGGQEGQAALSTKAIAMLSSVPR